MVDQSHLDSMYIIDERVYNCAFCNRRNVTYVITNLVSFDWNKSKKCYVYTIQCQSCSSESLHLTFNRLSTTSWTNSSRGRYCYFLPSNRNGENAISSYDDVFFYSVPTSFFVLDERIPRVLRELVTEAEGCLKSNYLTGASACARKVVYELSELQGASGDNYDEKLKSLKDKFGEIEGLYFDTLLTIQQITSTKVHEGAYDGWNANHVRLILAALREALHEIYVAPGLRKDRREELLRLRDELAPDVKDAADKNKTDSSIESGEPDT